jgi:hypothetical protein
VVLQREAIDHSATIQRETILHNSIEPHAAQRYRADNGSILPNRGPILADGVLPITA